MTPVPGNHLPPDARRILVDYERRITALERAVAAQSNRRLTIAHRFSLSGDMVNYDLPFLGPADTTDDAGVINAWFLRLRVAGTTTTTCKLYVNGTEVSTLSLAAGVYWDRKTLDIPITPDVEWIHMSLTAAGLGAVDLSSKLRMRTI